MGIDVMSERNRENEEWLSESFDYEQFNIIDEGFNSNVLFIDAQVSYSIPESPLLENFKSCHLILDNE